MYAHASQLNAQEKLISGAVAAGMHLLFLALLVFGVNWQKHIEPPVNMVDLWSPPAPVAEAPPAPPPEPAPPPPPQEVKPEPKLRTPAPVKAVPKPEAVKPDIAFKDQKDKEREKEHEKDREKEKRAEEKKQQDARRGAAPGGGAGGGGAGPFDRRIQVQNPSADLQDDAALR